MNTILFILLVLAGVATMTMNIKAIKAGDFKAASVFFSIFAGLNWLNVVGRMLLVENATVWPSVLGSVLITIIAISQWRRYLAMETPAQQAPLTSA